MYLADLIIKFQSIFVTYMHYTSMIHAWEIQQSEKIIKKM